MVECIKRSFEISFKQNWGNSLLKLNHYVPKLQFVSGLHFSYYAFLAIYCTTVPFGNYGNELKNIQYTKKQTM
jgi:hypothetical protein